MAAILPGGRSVVPVRLMVRVWVMSAWSVNRHSAPGRIRLAPCPDHDMIGAETSPHGEAASAGRDRRARPRAGAARGRARDHAARRAAPCDAGRGPCRPGGRPRPVAPCCRREPTPCHQEAGHHDTAPAAPGHAMPSCCILGCGLLAQAPALPMASDPGRLAQPCPRDGDREARAHARAGRAPAAAQAGLNPSTLFRLQGAARRACGPPRPPVFIEDHS